MDDISAVVVEVRQTREFSAWLNRLRDANAVARIIARIRRMEKGNPGDSRSVAGAFWKCALITDPAIASTMCIEEHKL